jgi:hypothetical protein
MGAQSRHLVMPFLLVALVLTLSLAGCCRMCTDDICTPRSPWQSPTIHASRSLLLVNTEELRIVLLDGAEAHPTCVAESGAREYHLVPGEHSMTAVFRYRDSLLADVTGLPLTLMHDFRPGHEYVAVYREHEGDMPEADAGLAEVASTVIGSPNLYWSLEILDVADEGNSEPEVEEARAYSAWVSGASANSGAAEPTPGY